MTGYRSESIEKKLKCFLIESYYPFLMNNYGQSCLDESESNDYVHARTAESGKCKRNGRKR